MVVYTEWWRVHMSIESAEQFLLRVESDPEILDEILDVLNNAETDEEKLSIIVSFAQKIGYYFNAIDIKIVSSKIGNVDDSQYEVYGGKYIKKNKSLSKLGINKIV